MITNFDLAREIWDLKAQINSLPRTPVMHPAIQVILTGFVSAITAWMIFWLNKHKDKTIAIEKIYSKLFAHSYHHIETAYGFEVEGYLCEYFRTIEHLTPERHPKKAEYKETAKLHYLNYNREFSEYAKSKKEVLEVLGELYFKFNTDEVKNLANRFNNTSVTTYNFEGCSYEDLDKVNLKQEISALKGTTNELSKIFQDILIYIEAQK